MTTPACPADGSEPPDPDSPADNPEPEPEPERDETIPPSLPGKEGYQPL